MALATLPEDLLRLIAHLLNQSSPHSLENFGLTNKRIRGIVRYIQLARIKVFIGTTQAAFWLQYLGKKESADLLPAVRQLSISEAKRTDQTQAKNDLTSISRLLQRMTGLKDVYILGVSALRELLATLSDLPQVKLHVTIHIDEEGNPAQEDELAELRNALNLESLDVQITCTSARTCSQIMQQLKVTLFSCPDLKHLSLAVRQPTGVGVDLSLPPDQSGLRFSRGEQLPPLKSLLLNNFPFDSSEVDHWAKELDWSSLERLETDNNDFAFAILPKLTNLRQAAHSSLWLDQDLSSFYLQAPSKLRSITVPTLRSITLNGILQHSDTLEALHMHQPESYYFHWKDYAIDFDSLRVIQQRCQHLEELSLDIARDDVWPWDIFDAVASFERLQSLYLWFELGVNHPSQPVQPFVTSKAVGQIFERIHGQASEKSALSKLVVHSGAPPPRPSGFLTPAASWGENNSISFECLSSERDDEIRTGVHRIESPELQEAERRLRLARSNRTCSGQSKSSTRRIFAGLFARSRGHRSSRTKHQDPLELSYQRIWKLFNDGPQPFQG